MKHNHDYIKLNVGDKVVKSSNKPFKSELKVNTISGYTINEHTSNDAYTFEEDESVVDCWKVKLAEG